MSVTAFDEYRIDEELATPANARTLRPETCFVLLALLLGGAMAFLTPPLQVPDESAHFFRVLQIAGGTLVAKDGMASIPVESIGVLVQSGLVTHNPAASVSIHHPFPGVEPGPLSGRFTATPIPNTTLYSPVPYLPAVMGLLLAWKLHGSILALFYAGRVGTVLGYTGIGWWAIRTTPVLRWVAAVTLTAPMALFLAGSVSADPMTTAFAYLATAYGLRLILAPAPPPRRVLAGCAFSLVALALCKTAYCPVVLLLAAVPRQNWRAGRWWSVPVSITFAVLLAAGVWTVLSHPTHLRYMPGDPAAQLHYVVYHPGKFPSNVGRTLARQWDFLYRTAFGSMGWLDVPMPVLWIHLFSAGVLWMVWTYDGPVSLPAGARLAAAAGVVAAVFLVVLADYLIWTPVGARTTDGLQGRYFLPLGLMLCAVLQRRGRCAVSPRWIMAGMAASNLLAFWCIVDRYYVR